MYEVREAVTFVAKVAQILSAKYKKQQVNGILVVKYKETGAELGENEEVEEGTELLFELKPNAGYSIEKLFANGVEIAADAPYTVTANVEFTATFAVKTTQYTVAYTKTPEHGTVQVKNGSVAVEPNATVAANTVLTLEFVPAANYKVKSVVAKVKDKADEVLTVTDNKATYTVIADVTFEVAFEAEGAPQPTYTVAYTKTPEHGTVQVKNGSVAVEPNTTVAANTVLTLEFAPAANYKVKSVVAKVKDKADEVLTVTDNKATYTVTANVTFEAAFEKVTALIDARLLNVAVMPNPFAAQFRIVGVAPEEVGVHYALLNALGVVVRSGVCTTEAVVETSDLRAGVYFLRLVMADGATKVLKLVKE